MPSFQPPQGPTGLPRLPSNGFVVPGANSPMVTTSSQYYTPISGSGTTVDSSGSPFHLSSGWFNQGSSAQGMPTGGAGLGTPGMPTQSGCGICDWVQANFLWVVVGIFALILLWVFVLK